MTSDEIATIRAAHTIRDERLSALPPVLDRGAALRVLSEALESHRAVTVLLDALEASQAQEARHRVALPDPAKLWSLAEWLEMKYPGDPNPEIQDDLRAWAKAIYATDPVKYGAYWVQAICDEEARAALAAAAEGKY